MRKAYFWLIMGILLGVLGFWVKDSAYVLILPVGGIIIGRNIHIRFLMSGTAVMIICGFASFFILLGWSELVAYPKILYLISGLFLGHFWGYLE